MISALLCDFDGTIINTLGLYVNAYKAALQPLGFELTDKEIITTCFGKTEEKICHSLGIEDKVSEFKRLYFTAANEFSQQAKLFPEVITTLEGLKRKRIKLAIISFAYRWYLERMIPALGLTNLFDMIIGFEDVASPKPAPDGVIKAANAFSLMPSNTAVIGDSKSDILMGKTAGAKTILFFPKENQLFSDKQTLLSAKPDFIISAWREVAEIVEL